MTQRYAVFGNPIAHSQSPLIHQLFAAQCDQNMVYTKKCIEPSEFDEQVLAFFNQGGGGLNITVPFKQAAYQLATELSPRAAQARAVNTLLLDNHQRIVGDNTDGCGLLMDMVEQQRWTIARARILVLGAGGAVAGILLPLLEANPSSVVIANRTRTKADALVQQFNHATLSSAEFASLSGHFDIIINGTSASLHGDLPPIPTSVIGSHTACVDMMYGAEPTVFLQWAQAQGAGALADGLGMLVCQAAEAFYLWRGVRPEVSPVIHQLRQSMSLG